MPSPGRPPPEPELAPDPLHTGGGAPRKQELLQAARRVRLDEQQEA